MSSSPEPIGGPSGSYDDSQPTQTQSAHMPAPRKKARVSQVEQIFTQPDAKEKQRIGEGYRDLQNKVDDDRANYKNLRVEDFQKAIDEQDAVFHSVQDTGLGALDARVFSNRLDVVATWSKELHQNTNSFDTDEFFMQIKNLLGLNRGRGYESDEDGDVQMDELNEDEAPRARRGGGEIGLLGDWEKVGWMAAKMSRRVQGIEFMYGPLSIEHKKRVLGARQKRAPLAPEVKPTEINKETEKKAEDDSTVHVMKTFKALRKADPLNEGINFFRFAVNPHSFGQTVENVFFISFLIRDGKVGLEMREDGEMFISRAEQSAEGGAPQGPTHQGVMEFDMAAWELAKETFNITECLIPNRKPKDLGVPNGGAWY